PRFNSNPDATLPIKSRRKADVLERRTRSISESVAVAPRIALETATSDLARYISGSRTSTGIEPRTGYFPPQSTQVTSPAGESGSGLRHVGQWMGVIDLRGMRPGELTRSLRRSWLVPSARTDFVAHQLIRR